MNGNPTHSDRVRSSVPLRSLDSMIKPRPVGIVRFGTMAAIVCGFSVLISEPVMAQMANPSASSPAFEVRTAQGEALKCQTSTVTSTSVICERATVMSSAQPLDGATDMLLKMIYLGLPGVVLVGISFRTLHLHRQLMRQRAFVESLERIWERTVSY
jgi:hypothetical protein